MKDDTETKHKYLQCKILIYSFISFFFFLFESNINFTMGTTHVTMIIPIRCTIQAVTLNIYHLSTDIFTKIRNTE